VPCLEPDECESGDAADPLIGFHCATRDVREDPYVACLGCRKDRCDDEEQLPGLEKRVIVAVIACLLDQLEVEFIDKVARMLPGHLNDLTRNLKLVPADFIGPDARVLQQKPEERRATLSERCRDGTKQRLFQWSLREREPPSG
jgi:hypothetical protein